MHRLIRRLAYFFRHRRHDSDLREEIESHRAMTQARLEASGLPRDAARIESRRSLGNVTLAREDARSVWIWPWLDAARLDIGYALRALRRNPGFACAVIVVTSLGIGATTSVFGMLDALVLKPLPVDRPDRLVYFQRPSFSYPVFMEVRKRGGDIFSSVSAWNLESVHVDWRGELEPAEILMASGDFYSTLGVQAAIGRTFTPEDDRIGGGPHGMVAVLSHAAWQRRFAGDPSVIGRTVRISRQPFTIIGVAPRGFFGVAAGLAPELTIPLTSLENTNHLNSTTSTWLHFICRVRDGLTHEQADGLLQREWPGILEATTNPGMPADRRAVYQAQRTALVPGYAGFSRVRNQFADPLWILLGLVGLLFTIACASAANLLLARGVERQRELAIRLAVGASRGRLVRQFLTESLVWTTLGALAGLLLAIWTGNLVVAMIASPDEPIVLDLDPNWRIALFVLALVCLTVMLCSVLPAFRATTIAPAPALKTVPAGAPAFLRRWTIGKALVATQVALTMILIVGGALFVRSLTSVLSQDAGVDRRDVLVVSTDAEAAGYDGERLGEFYRSLDAALAAIPGVASTSVSRYPPISHEDGAWTQSIAVEGAEATPEAERTVHFNSVSPGYFATVGTRLLQGRDFTPADRGPAPRVAIVNDSLARRFFPDASPLGRRIAMGRDSRRQELEIVGIAADAKYRNMKEPQRAIVYLPLALQAPGRNLFVEVRPAAGSAAIVEPIRRGVRALDASVPMRIGTVADRINESLIRDRAMAILASALGCIALVLASTGLYGILAYAVSRQTKELGVRLALGARRDAVVALVMRECLVLAAIGIAIGVAGSLALGRFARALLYQVSTSDGVSLAVAVVIMLVVAALAGFVPARRAANVDPVVALKSE
ncbi:MAG TPA: ABC transporter permease [Vicinamibacterales bacterium]